MRRIIAPSIPEEPKRVESGAWILILESAVALCLLLFIVWWTWPRK